MTDVAGTETPPASESSRRSRWPVVLVILASVLAVVSTLATWVRTEMLDTNEWVKVSDDLLAEPQVQEALATYLTNELYERVDVKAELTDLLPEDLSGLAGPLAGALRSPTENAIDQLVASQQFATVWRKVNRDAHELIVAVLRDETRPGVSTADGTVTLDLKPLIKDVGDRVGLSGKALDQLPDDAGTIVVFQSGDLSSAQTLVQVLDFLSWFLFVAVAGLYVLAVVLARGFRRRALQMVGAGLVTAGVTLLVLRLIGVRAVVGISSFDADKPVGNVIGDVATELLRQIAWTGVVYGLLVFVFAWLIGPQKWAVAVRRPLGRFADSRVAVGVGSLIAVLLVIWWNPGRAFANWWSALFLVILAIAAVVVLLRQVSDEETARTPTSDGAT